MLKKYKLRNPPLEVKKLNKPILTMMALVAVLFINVQYADAEMLTLQGSSDEISMFFAVEGDMNMLQVVLPTGDVVEVVDSKIKMYQSGSFSLKNLEAGIAMWAHAASEGNYKIVVLTSDGVYRLTTTTDVTEKVERAEPVSSVGADITRYDIPTENPKDRVRDARIWVSFDEISHILINNEYVPNVKIVNQDFQKIASDVSIEITRDGESVKSISGSTATGQWNPVINILDSKFTPGFCYTVTITAVSGNHTDTAQDDFSVFSTGKYWDSSADPIDADSQCNK